MGASIGSAMFGSIGLLVGGVLGTIIGAIFARSVRPGSSDVTGADTLRETRLSEIAAGVPLRGDVDASSTRRSEAPISSTSAQPASDLAASDATVTVPLVEERLEIDKQELEAGAVRLRKVVKTEIVHVPVELRREEIIVERVPEGTVTPASETTHLTAHQRGDEIVIPLVKEEAIVQKETKVFSEVHVHKVSRTETRTIQEQVRHTEVSEEHKDDA